MPTLLEAAKTVASAADGGTYLSDELRDAMRVTVSAAKVVLADEGYRRETEPLKELIHHMMIHSAYPKNGYNKMTREQRELYDSVYSEMAGE